MRYEATKKVGITGIIGNAFLLIIKAVVGYFSHSQAMIADALNSASDIFASVMTTIGNKIARVPSDEDHNFGHGKAEYIFSMFISLSMMGLSLKILLDSISSILGQQGVIFSIPLLLASFITIIVKISLFLYTRKLYKKYPNVLISSTMYDHRNDFIIALFTMMSIIFSYFHIHFVDGVVGIGISIWIFYTGTQIFIQSYRVLMDASLKEEDKEKLKEIVLSMKEVKKVDEIYSVPVGYDYIVVLTIFVSGRLSTKKSHDIADELEKKIQTEMECVQKAIVHVNPL